MKPKTNILIIEPSDIIRTGIKALIDEDEFSFLAPLRDLPADLPLRLTRLQPDILLLNPTLLPSPARMQLAALTQARPNMSVVALVYQYVEPQLLEAFSTVLDIREQGSHVAQRLRECCQTEKENAEESYELSDRESEVLVLVAQGLSSKEIADRLHISIHTVNTHRKNITHKTGIKSVAGLAVYAMLHNLV
ncbi:MAG: response regulator transcription factor [Bacteroidales bacterium]|nr:response regulator transcription factor [Bacteroidales bacterium]